MLCSIYFSYMIIQKDSPDNGKNRQYPATAFLRKWISNDEMHDALKLVKIQTKAGAYHLFSEYAENPERFFFMDSPKAAPETVRSSRNVFLVDLEDGSGFIVVKPERPRDDFYRNILSWRVPLHANLALKEVSIARALSKYAGFEDDEIGVRFEKPFGYFEDKDGKRFALFEYIRGMGELDICPQNHPDLGMIWRAYHRYLNTVPGFEINEFTDFMFVAEYILLPRHFGRDILGFNGIQHNELPVKDHVQEEGRKMVSYIVDYEFCSPKRMDRVRGLIQRQIPWTLDRDKLKYCRMVEMDGLEARLNEAMDNMIKRFERYFGVDLLAQLSSYDDVGPIFYHLDKMNFDE